MDLPSLHARLTMLAQTREALRPFAEDKPFGYEQLVDRLRGEAERLIEKAAARAAGEDWFAVCGADARSFEAFDELAAFVAARADSADYGRFIDRMCKQAVGEAVSYPVGRGATALIVLRLPGGTLNV